MLLGEACYPIRRNFGWPSCSGSTQIRSEPSEEDCDTLESAESLGHLDQPCVDKRCNLRKTRCMNFKSDTRA